MELRTNAREKRRPSRAAAGLLLALTLAGCGREDIRVYQAPKEQRPAVSEPPARPQADAPADFKMEAPGHWQAQPASSLLAAKYLIRGENDVTASVTVSVLPGAAGGMAANINRWRQQIGLPPEENLKVAEVTQPLEMVNGLTATLVELAGPADPTGVKSRMLVAVIPQGNRTWFFKMTGNDALVGREKTAFLKCVTTARLPHAP